MATDTVTYGVRGPDACNTVVTAPSRQAALDMLLPGDRLVESFDGGQTWGDGRARIVDGELRDYGSSRCDDCGTGLLLPGWLCADCARDRGVRRGRWTGPGPGCRLLDDPHPPRRLQGDPVTRYAERTEVPSEKSRAEIERTLRRYGASAFAYGWQGLEAQVMFELADRRIRFAIPMPDPADNQFVLTPTGRERSEAAAEKEYEQAVRQRWRALALLIKAKLEAVEAGISTVEDEFLAHVVLPDGSTVGEWAAPQLQVAYSRGEMPALLPGGGHG